MPLSTFEIIAAAYFIVIGLLCPFAGAPPRRAGAVSATAFVLAAAVVAVATSFQPARGRGCPHAYLVAGYWLPALVVTARPAAFESWLLKTERAWRTLPTAAWTLPPPLKPRRTGRLPPGGGARLPLLLSAGCPPHSSSSDMNGSTGDVNRFWTAGARCRLRLLRIAAMGGQQAALLPRKMPHRLSPRCGASTCGCSIDSAMDGTRFQWPRRHRDRRGALNDVGGARAQGVHFCWWRSVSWQERSAAAITHAVDAVAGAVAASPCGR